MSSFPAAEFFGGITLCLLDDIGNHRTARVALETGRLIRIFQRRPVFEGAPLRGACGWPPTRWPARPERGCAGDLANGVLPLPRPGLCFSAPKAFRGAGFAAVAAFLGRVEGFAALGTWNSARAVRELLKALGNTATVISSRS